MVTYLSGARAAVRNELDSILRDAANGQEIPEYRIAAIGMGAAQNRALRAAIPKVAETDHEGRSVVSSLGLGNFAHQIAASLDREFEAPREWDMCAALDGDPEALLRVKERQDRDRIMESIAEQIANGKAGNR